MFDTLLKYRQELDGEFTVPGSGYKSGIVGDTSELESAVFVLIEKLEAEDLHHAVIKARVLRHILENGEIEVNPHALFCERINHGNCIDKCFSAPRRRKVLRELCATTTTQAESFGKSASFSFNADFGHVCHDWRTFSKLGFVGTLNTVKAAREIAKTKGWYDESAQAFYESCIITYEALIAFIKRYALEVKPLAHSDDTEIRQNMSLLYNSLCSISENPPANFHQALLCYTIMFYVSEIIFSTRVRTLGGIDRDLYFFYKNDLESGVFTQEELQILLRQFLFRLWAMRIPYDLPFMLGGIDEHGNCVVNELSHEIVRQYMKLGIHSPKIHIRVTDNTPENFINLVLESIRSGSSSFVFCNDNVIINALLKHGIDKTDARQYLPIGCYEPAAAQEIACTGAGHIDLARITNIALFGGYNPSTQMLEGVKDETVFSDFNCFYEAFKRQFMCIADRVMSGICEYEKYFYQMNPNPLLSATYSHALKKGRDIYDGGAKYSNSSFQIMFLPTCVDILSAIKQVVFDKKLCTVRELKNALQANFKGYSSIRNALLKADKYGNGSEICTRLTKDIAQFTSSYCNNKPNGRGGFFRTGCFSIDYNVIYGTICCATADGRLAGTAFSKNLCTSPGFDKQGITALINDATALDHTNFANGTVLDIVLHPSAVSGNEGLVAFNAILKTYFSKGGFALHGNVFDAEILKKAQKHPEEYKNLQVRVCGWNVFFVNLSKTEQDLFIAQAEAAQ